MAASVSWSILCKEFVDISYDNASFGIQEDFIWLQVIDFLTTITFWSMKYHAQIRHYGKFMALHKLISIVLQLTNQFKQKFPAQSCGAIGLFT